MSTSGKVVKRIIVLSDGTGNGASVSNKSNVWRLYQALDLHVDDQVAFYDDGVGSAASTFDKVMGGAFGYGLKRNILEMYTYICRNYEQGDKIYLFGFSRGAFTVRLLAGFLKFAGIKQTSSLVGDDELQAIAGRNFDRYRDHLKKGLLRRLYRKIYRSITGFSSAVENDLLPEDVDIHFIGVWDTVDAYVFPIDELAIIWNSLIYPIWFTNHQLNTEVGVARHALAVDDERHTFHPVLWDESTETKGRIKQVWFPGVHSDIGGGYARKSLSLVSLAWMIRELERDVDGKELKFLNQKKILFAKQADWNGPMHDSRSGLAAYFRYKPRDIKALTDGSDKCVKIETPLIHRSVFERLKGNSQEYAPTGLPIDYKIEEPSPTAPPFEKDIVARKQRDSALSYARDCIFLRRGLYYLFLVATFLLLTSRYFLDWREEGVCIGSACFIDYPLQVLMSIVPDVIHPWFEALRQNPSWLYGFLVVFVLLFTIRSMLYRCAVSKATAAWGHVKYGKDVTGASASIITKFRKLWAERLESTFLKFISFVIFIIILYLLVALVNGFFFHTRSTLGTDSSWGTCKQSEQPSEKFMAADGCIDTGIMLKAGYVYRFVVSSENLCDLYYEATADGLNENQVGGICGESKNEPGVLMTLITPFRRHISQPWFRLHGKVSADGNEVFVLGEGEFEYKARSDGRLFMYLNDAVIGLSKSWDYFYKNNDGTISIDVEELPLINQSASEN